MKRFHLKFDKDVFNVFYIKDINESIAILKKLSSCKLFGLDIETARADGYVEYVPIKKGNKKIGPQPGLCPYLSKIRLIQLYNGRDAFVFDCFYNNGVNLFTEFFNGDRSFVAHNGIFEIKHFSHNGFTNLNINCSMLMAMLVDRAKHSPYEPAEDEDENEEQDGLASYKRQRYSLDAVIKDLFDIKISKQYQTSDWNKNILSKEQICYAGLDALLTYKIYKKLLPEIKAMKMETIYQVQKSMQHVIAEMELTGFKLNKKAHISLIRDWEDKKVISEKKCSKFFKGVNLRSPPQMNEWLKKKFKDNLSVLERWPQSPTSTEEKIKYSFNRGLIYEFYDYPEIATYLEFKKVDKLLNTYGTTLEQQIHPITGRVHCSFSLGETRTGRMSSYNPNLQNLPRDSDVRSLFIPEVKNELIVGDFNQIEMRVAGALSKDRTMIEAFRSKDDLHRKIVRVVMNLPDSANIDEGQRQLGKAVNFGLAFGMGPTKLQRYVKTSYNKDISEDDAQEYYNAYHYRLYTGYSNWCRIARSHSEVLGYARTPLGKKRKLTKDEIYTKAVNTPVQGGAAEVMFLALIKLYKLRDKYSLPFKIINCIHDEIILEVSRKSINKVKRALDSSMQYGMKRIFPTAPLNGIAEIHSGSTWQIAKKGKPMKAA